MIEPWNDALLAPPPVNTFRRTDYSIDYNGISTVIEDMTQILSNQIPLHQEGAILSRLIYKYDKKFRNDIGYRNLKKVNTALRRYPQVNLVKDVDSFAAVVHTDSNDDYLPTKQMLQYLLVRIQSFSKIMVRTIVCAKKSAIFYWDRVTRGESHWMSLMPYAVLCRIWSLCSILLKHACMWYSRLYQYLDKLKIVGIPFLPDGYSLPNDIEVWLDIKNIDDHGKFNWSRNKCIEILSSLIEDETEESIDIFQYVQNVKNEVSNDIDVSESQEHNMDRENKVEESKVDTYSKTSVKNTDIGEVISREHFKRTHTEIELLNPSTPIENEPVSKKAKLKNEEGICQLHSPEFIANKKDLEKFLLIEEEFRNNGSALSLTKHLSLMQWLSLKMALTNLCQNQASGKFIKVFKKMWKRKCTDYL